MTQGFISAIGSHVGMIRTNNQDSGYAGAHLFFVADGMGGHAGGDVASALTTRDVATIDNETFESSKQAVSALKDRLLAANRMLSETVQTRPELAGMGTTFCGLVETDGKLGLAHIGDSRLYVFRGGKLTQVTKDHTFVQRLVDSGRITEEEAKTHPRRSVLMRVLGDVDSSPNIDTELLETSPGDLWLLCSDGLCGYVDEHVIEETLRKRTSLQQAVDELIDVTLSRGAPDNVTVVLVETVEQAPRSDQPTPTDEDEPAPQGRFVGSAASDDPGTMATGMVTPRPRLGTLWRGRKAQPVAETQFEPRVDEYLAELIAETKRQSRKRRMLWLLTLLLGVGILAGLVGLGYQWTQTRYYVGTDGETIIIYRGVQQQIGSFRLSSEAEDTLIPLDSLNPYQRSQVERTLDAGSFEEAREIVTRLGGDNG